MAKNKVLEYADLIGRRLHGIVIESSDSSDESIEYYVICPGVIYSVTLSTAGLIHIEVENDIYIRY